MNDCFSRNVGRFQTFDERILSISQPEKEKINTRWGRVFDFRTERFDEFGEIDELIGRGGIAGDKIGEFDFDSKKSSRVLIDSK
jgi:hypothetical protein